MKRNIDADKGEQSRGCWKQMISSINDTKIGDNCLQLECGLCDTSKVQRKTQKRANVACTQPAHPFHVRHLLRRSTNRCPGDSQTPLWQRHAHRGWANRPRAYLSCQSLGSFRNEAMPICLPEVACRWCSRTPACTHDVHKHLGCRNTLCRVFD